MEDWLKCQLGPLVNYRQNQNMDNFHALQISLQVITECPSSIHVTNNRTPNNSLLYSETGSIRCWTVNTILLVLNTITMCKDKP